MRLISVRIIDPGSIELHCRAPLLAPRTFKSASVEVAVLPLDPKHKAPQHSRFFTTVHFVILRQTSSCMPQQIPSALKDSPSSFTSSRMIDGFNNDVHVEEPVLAEDFVVCIITSEIHAVGIEQVVSSTNMALGACAAHRTKSRPI